MCVKDNNYNWAATRQNLSSVCPTKLYSNQFTQLQRLARKMKAVAQSNYQIYSVTYVSSNQQCERSILKLWLSSLYFWWFQQLNATSERTFSAFRRVKTYFRNTMTQTRVNNLITLHTQGKNRRSRLESNRERVHWRNEQRRCVFGKF